MMNKDIIDKEKELKQIFNKCSKNKQPYYFFEYLIKYINKDKYVQSDVITYTNQRRFDDVKKYYGDAPRGIKKLVNNTYGHIFEVISNKDPKTFKYLHPCERYNNEEKNNNFNPKQKDKRIKECKGFCELTGIKLTKNTGNADHFWPKDRGGYGDDNNCVWLHKYLNNQKRNREPIEWFCNVFITNFLNICKRTGYDIQYIKEIMIMFIQDF